MSDPRARARRLLAFGPFVLGVIEIVVFVLVAEWIGLGWTILLALATSFIGFWALRLVGFRAWRGMRRAAEEGRLADSPATERKVASTGAGILAAAMLAIPGFVTDVLGLILLIPPVRASIGHRVARSALASFADRGARTHPYRRGPRAEPEHIVIEGEIVEPGTTRAPRLPGARRPAGPDDVHDDPRDDPDGT